MTGVTVRRSIAIRLVPALTVVAAGLLALPTAPVVADGHETGDPEAAPAGPVKTREVVGTSVQGRPITLIHRADPGATERVLVIGSIHGDERAGQRVVRRLLDRPHLPDNLDLWLLKTVNPDGVAADRRTNAHGVDLNRNFPYRWRASARGETWSGREPLSEPESEVLRQVVRRVQPWLIVTFHQPLFGVGENEDRMPTVRALAEEARLPVRDFNCNGVCRGTFTGWVNNRTDSLAVTVEFGRTASDWRIRRAELAIVRVGARVSP